MSCAAVQGEDGGASMQMARVGGGLERIAQRVDARFWRLRRGGGDGDGMRKMKSVVNRDPWRAI
jgi:hypothetical protein